MPHELMPIFPFLIPIAGMLMVVAVVGIIFWYKAREKELQFHQDLRMREMENQKRLKELELEIEKVKAAGGSSKASP